MNVSTHKFPEPTQCVLWSAPDSVRGNFEDHFELVKTYDDDNHLIRRLLKCRECGQQYFYEMFEEIDWDTVQRESGYTQAVSEHTTVTGMLRRVGRFDWDLARKAARINRPTRIALNFLDYISASNRAANDFEELTPESKDFIRRLQDDLSTTISYAGVGPSTERTLSRLNSVLSMPDETAGSGHSEAIDEPKLVATM